MVIAPGTQSVYVAPVGARLVSTHDPMKVIELAGATLTIGRAADCELQIADDRVSARHCRLSLHGVAWVIQDLRSTNRTFVNGAPLGDQPCPLGRGDIVRLGALDAVLLEVRFVITDAPRIAEPASPQPDDSALRHQLAELQAELRQRSAELVRASAEAARIQAMYKDLQVQRLAQAAASTSAERTSAALASELDGLRGELARERTEHDASRDAVQRLERRTAELEALLAAQERKGRADGNDATLRVRDLESRLRVAESDLAVARDALATASASIRNLQQAHTDAVTRLAAVAPSDADDSSR